MKAKAFQITKYRIPALSFILLFFFSSIQGQKLLDKLDKSVKDLEIGAALFGRTVRALSYLKTSTKEFNEKVLVVDGNSEKSEIATEDVNELTIKNGKIKNISWEPVNYFEHNLFPSAILGMSSYNSSYTPELRAIKGTLGIAVSSNLQDIPIHWEIECVDKKYFDKISGVQMYDTPGKSVYIMPEIPWDYETLASHESSNPISVKYKIFDSSGKSIERVETMQMRSISDCIYRYKDTSLEFLFSAFVQEEHPEIDVILREALDTKITTSISGYQSSKNDILLQVAAIWKVLHDRGFQYSSITTNAESTENIYSQTVRSFDKSIKTSQANCVDGTVVFASILRRIGISTKIVLVPGHCFLGFYTNSKYSDIEFLETTMLSRSNFINQAESEEELRAAYINQFSEAIVAGGAAYKMANENGSVTMIDVDDARKKIQPIPFKTEFD